MPPWKISAGLNHSMILKCLHYCHSI